MPVVAISSSRLNELLGKQYELDILVDALEQLGCDVEDTASIHVYECPKCQAPNDRLDREEPPKRCEFCGHESESVFETVATNEVIRIDLLANRPDLFDVGGLSRALSGTLGLQNGLPQFTAGHYSGIEVHVSPDVMDVRPHIVCAVVTMPPLDRDGLREIMQLQENLHWGIGRNRKLSSIGIYDMTSLTPPLRYTALAPDDLRFHPLGMPDSLMTLREVTEQHPKGIAYGHLVKDYPAYPLLLDANDTVLSMPPIINSEETKCRAGSTRLFIDVTGITSEAVTNSLNTLVCALIDLGAQVETVKILHPGRTSQTPDLDPAGIDIRIDDAVRWLGIPLSDSELISYLQKMRLDVSKKENKGEFEVKYPVYRTDIMHPVDIFEDIAIAYGFPNIETKLVPTMTVGRAREEEMISGMARDIMIGLGYMEVMSLVLQSEERHFDKFLQPAENEHVIVKNPKTIEQKIARTHMMTGIMETFHRNRKKSVPQRIFEIGNIIKTNAEMETGVNEYRQLCFGIIGPNAGYAEARATLDSVLREFEWKGEYRALNHPAFIEGRCAEVVFAGNLKGLIGEVHPQVINNFGLAHPVAVCEIRLHKII